VGKVFKEETGSGKRRGLTFIRGKNLCGRSLILPLYRIARKVRTSSFALCIQQKKKVRVARSKGGEKRDGMVMAGGLVSWCVTTRKGPCTGQSGDKGRELAGAGWLG